MPGRRVARERRAAKPHLPIELQDDEEREMNAHLDRAIASLWEAGVRRRLRHVLFADVHALHLRWWADDSMLGRDILASFKARFPTHHDRSYAESTKTWSVPRCHYGRLAEWVDRWFDEQDQHWTDEEPAGHGYGRTSSDRGSSYDRYGKTQAGARRLAAAFARLHLLPSAPAWAAEAVYKAAIKVHHPHAGGDGQTMVRINLAMETIREHQEHERKAS